jgi:hypothetical protein
MVIVQRENTSDKSSLKENFSLEDVIGLSGFTGYSVLTGSKVFASAHDAFLAWRGSLTLDIGKGVSAEDVRLMLSKRLNVVSFPVANIKSIGMRQLEVIFTLKDGSTITFHR